MYDAKEIVLSPETIEAGRIYRESVELARLGKFDEAIRSIGGLPAMEHGLRPVFRDEALLEIVSLCCEANQREKASEVAKAIGLQKFQKRAFEILGLDARK
jgi:hypothetical protein